MPQYLRDIVQHLIREFWRESVAESQVRHESVDEGEPEQGHDLS